MKMCGSRHSGQMGMVITPPRLTRLTLKSMPAIARLRHCVGVAPPDGIGPTKQNPNLSG
jgi:hypothetical protein